MLSKSSGSPQLVRSLPSPGYSIWNPWNECWLKHKPFFYSINIMESIWNGYEIVMEWSIPCGIQYHSIWNGGISTLNSNEQPRWIPWNKSSSMEIQLEFPENYSILLKIVVTSRIEHTALEDITWSHLEHPNHCATVPYQEAGHLSSSS